MNNSPGLLKSFPPVIGAQVSLRILAGTSVAPICWVIPPASLSMTLACLSLPSDLKWSRTLVLPWSTWPRTATIGWRCQPNFFSSSSGAVSKPSPSSDMSKTPIGFLIFQLTFNSLVDPRLTILFPVVNAFWEPQSQFEFCSICCIRSVNHVVANVHPEITTDCSRRCFSSIGWPD